jgi:hypothetical protein
MGACVCIAVLIRGIAIAMHETRLTLLEHYFVKGKMVILILMCATNWMRNSLYYL